MALKTLFSGAVIYCFRSDVKEALRTELKRSGVQKTEIAANADEAREKLLEDESALLVVEWDQDPAEAVKVLDATKKADTIEIRPILLIAKAMTPQLVATAYEYHKDSGGQKLSKSRQSFALHEYRALGKTPREVIQLAAQAVGIESYERVFELSDWMASLTSSSLQ